MSVCSLICFFEDSSESFSRCAAVEESLFFESVSNIYPIIPNIKIPINIGIIFANKRIVQNSKTIIIPEISEDFLFEFFIVYLLNYHLVPSVPLEGYYFPRLSVPVFLNDLSAATASSFKHFR